jgi:hypothetical protein
MNANHAVASLSLLRIDPRSHAYIYVYTHVSFSYIYTYIYIHTYIHKRASSRRPPQRHTCIMTRCNTIKKCQKRTKMRLQATAWDIERLARMNRLLRPEKVCCCKSMQQYVAATVCCCKSMLQQYVAATVCCSNILYTVAATYCCCNILLQLRATKV